MPIRSKAQWREFAAEHPDLLHKWQAEAPVNYADLPEHARSTHTMAAPSDLLAALGGPADASADASQAPEDKGLSSFKDYVDDMIADAKAAHDMADDDQEAQTMTKILDLLQGIKATRQKENDAALGGKVSPSALRKQTASSGSY